MSKLLTMGPNGRGKAAHVPGQLAGTTIGSFFLSLYKKICGVGKCRHPQVRCTVSFSRALS